MSSRDINFNPYKRGDLIKFVSTCGGGYKAYPKNVLGLWTNVAFGTLAVVVHVDNPVAMRVVCPSGELLTVNMMYVQRVVV